MVKISVIVPVYNVEDYLRLRSFYEQSSEIIDEDYYSMPYLKETVGENTFNYNDISKITLDLCNEYYHPYHKKELYYRIFNNIYNIFKKADSSQGSCYLKKSTRLS